MATLLVAVLTLAGFAGSASAYDPQYYDDPAYATALTSLAVASGSGYTGAAAEAGMNTGGTYAGASQAEAIRNALARARIAARVLPPIGIALAGDILLGAGALYLGVEIGRGIDTKFLGGDGLLGQTWGDAYIAGTKWRKSTMFSAPLAAELGISVGDPYWIYYPTNAASLNNPNSGWYFTCPGGWSWNSCQQWSGYQEAANDSWLDALDDATAAVPTAHRIDNWYCNSPNTPARSCSALFLTASELDNLISWTSFKDYNASTDTVTHYVPSWNPSYSAQGFASQADQNAAFANALSAAASASPGEFADNAVNPTGTVSSPLIDFQMPDCFGMSVSDCEDAITAAADAADATVSFSVTTAPTADSNVAQNLVLSTFPAAGSISRPASVALTQNPASAAPRECNSTTDNPHWSYTSNSMLAKGHISCNYTGTANYEMTLWHCSQSPQSDFGQLIGGAYGCSVPAETVETTLVSPAPPSPPREVYVPHVSPPGTASPVSWAAGYWIAATVLTNPSPIINGAPSISQGGWQPPPP